MREPRTTREALVAQMLDELDILLTRVEQLPTAIAEAEKRVAATTQILNEAGDRYRYAVTAFTDEAKSVLTEYVRRKAAETVMENEQCAGVEDIVRRVLHAERAILAEPPNRCEKPHAECFRTRRFYLVEHGLTAVFASLVTTCLLSVAGLF